MAVATFRFYEELNDFLLPERRKVEFEYACARRATVKNAIEALGVPHTEVELILANGVSVDFSYMMQDGDRIAVYPVFEAFDIRPALRLRPDPLRRPRFVADAHLGGLARFLRMLGFDTLYSNAYYDRDIREIAARESRIILTRDRDLLKCRDVTHGCFVHALKPERQIAEMVRRLQLERDARPFTLCLECNVPLQPVEKSAVVDRVPPNAARYYDRFSVCPNCSGIFWEGSHWKRMTEVLSDMLSSGSHE
ncbi:MAG TPA: Mut7-C RNAse domain-containing protein [Burkholderiales bacterium]|nr:Mut7-C RNAse domain-containing protein [Burkholderiales bacterium]